MVSDNQLRKEALKFKIVFMGGQGRIRVLGSLWIVYSPTNHSTAV